MIRHVIQADIFNHQYRCWYKRGHWCAKAMSLFKGPPIGHHIMPFGLRSGPLQNGQRGHSINIFCIVCLTLGFLACHVRASKEKPLDLESKSCLLTKKVFFLNISGFLDFFPQRPPTQSWRNLEFFEKKNPWVYSKNSWVFLRIPWIYQKMKGYLQNTLNLSLVK